jgi:phosphatidylserine decarboxylase
MKTTANLIAQEGIKPILYSVGVLIIFLILDIDFLFFLGTIFTIVQILFFYNPEREPEEVDELAVIAPVDGKIKEINIKENSVEIIIDNSLVDPHFIRSILEIAIEKIQYTRGVFLFRSNKNSNSLNESAILSFKHKRKKFSLILESSYIKFPISFYEKEKAKFLTGKRIGFFGGGIATLICPKEMESKVSVGTNIRAGESLLGFIK